MISQFRNSVKTLLLPDGLKTIGSDCFINCSGLTELVIPDGVESLGASFRNCASLSRVTLPSTLAHIDANAFENCGSAVFTVREVPGYSRACVDAFLQNRLKAPETRTMEITADRQTDQVGEEVRWTLSITTKSTDTYSVRARVQNPLAGYYGEWREFSELNEYPAVIAETVRFSGEYSLEVEIYDIEFDEYEDDSLVTVIGDPLPPFTATVVCDRETARGDDTVTWTITPVGGTPGYEIRVKVVGGGPYEENPFQEAVLHSNGEPVQYAQQLLFGSKGGSVTYALNVEITDSSGRVYELDEEMYDIAVEYIDPVYGFPYADIHTAGEMCLDGQVYHMLTPEDGMGPYTDFTVSLLLMKDESLINEFVFPSVAKGETVTVDPVFSSAKYRGPVGYHIRESFTDALGYRWSYEPSGSAHHFIEPFGTLKTSIAPPATDIAVGDTVQWTIAYGRDYYGAQDDAMNYAYLTRNGAELIITPCVRDILSVVREAGTPQYVESWGEPVVFSMRAEEEGSYFLRVLVRDSIKPDGAAFEGGNVAVSSPSAVGMLILPAGLTAIDAEAFAGVQATAVRIPTACLMIGERAFAGSAVRTAYVPASVAQIGADTFPAGTAIITPTGSPAAAWGRDNGCSVIEK